MNEQKLTSLLRQQSPDLAVRTPFCPEDQQIAAWFDGEMPHHAREAIQRHLVDCGFCTARIGVLAKLHESSDGEAIHGDLLATAKQMSRSLRTRRTIPAPAWAAAAMVALAVLLNYNSGPELNQITDSTPTVTPDVAQTREVRNLEREALIPRLLSPTEGDSVDAGDLTIRWTEIPGSLYYDLYIMSDAGDLVLETRLEGTAWSGQPTEPLLPGAEYFVRVEAHLADSRSVSSQHILFKVAERD